MPNLLTYLKLAQQAARDLAAIRGLLEQLLERQTK